MQEEQDELAQAVNKYIRHWKSYAPDIMKLKQAKDKMLEKKREWELKERMKDYDKR